MTRARSTGARGVRRAVGSLSILALLSLVVGGTHSCGGGDEPAKPEVASLEDTLTRERVAHWFRDSKLEQARQVLAPLVAGEDAHPDDLLRAAAIEYALGDGKRSEAFLARSEEVAPDSAALHFLRGQIAKESGEPDRALTELRRAHELAPDDLPTRYILAKAERDIDNFEEAEALLRSVLDAGIENGLSWYVSALHTLGQLLYLDGREQEAQPLMAEKKRLEDQGLKALDAVTSRLGTFGRIAPPDPGGSVVATPPSELAFGPAELELPLLAGALELRAHDVDGDGRMDLVARLADGLVVAMQGRDGWTAERVLDRPVDLVRAYDLDNEPDAGLELLVAAGNELRFLKKEREGWKALPVQVPELPGEPADIALVDFDHEGDIDLLIVGDFGAQLWRNDGAWIVGEAAQGAYVDATETAGLPQGRAFDWASSEDFDGDNDVDLLVGGSSGLYLADSLRAGKFADQSSRLGGAAFASEPLLADFNGDGRPDALATGEVSQLWLQAADGSFSPSAKGNVPHSAEAVDLDCDGSLDLVWGSQALLAVSLAQETAVPLAGVEAASGAPQAILDANGDLRLDLVRITPTGVLLSSATEERGDACLVNLRGNRSNKRGMGSTVEVRAGGMYRRVYMRGEPVLVGKGTAQKLDVLRLTYPNGIISSHLDHVCEQSDLIDDPDAAWGQFAEPTQQNGSCPFLYTWNGETYEFITDVLGITPLGLPMAPGMMVPPDHDEFVLVSGEQLRAEDGLLEVQFTEELREVTYLDRIRLDVVDHPEGTEVYPNELFKFPPFPEEHLHTVEDPVAVLRATGSDGQDWTAALAELDEEHAIPFTKQPPQFQGLAEPWFLELEFDPERLRDAQRLRLVMTGWFFWSDASANMAAAGHPGVDFVPPIIEVPDGDGGWRATGPPIGFPAGKTKTMVIDVSEIGLQALPRLRMFCTLQLHWDRIVLAVDGDDAERRMHSIEPVGAKLWRRGFSQEIETGNPGNPLCFDWERVTEVPRWNPHPGKYTRLGEVLPLVQEVDDRYVIMGTGESLEVHFDASSLPPVQEGWRRDYLVYLDGWAKDRDPNTLEALEVEPLPFHGMSGYPYRADESFPDDEEHQEWRREWNTREPELWLEPLAPGS